MNYNMIAYLLGNILRIEGLLMAIPTAIAVFYREERPATAFIASIAFCMMGAAFFESREPKNKRIYGREGFIVVALSWIVMSLFGALPYYLSGTIHGFINCYFETVSGFTTTGASVVTEVESLPNSIIFWRCFTHWIGGMGILVFMLAIMPLGDERTMHLMKAEAPGPLVSKLVPKVKSTAKILYIIYVVLTLLEMLLLYLGGMPWFDSVIHAISTAGTGGFSNKNNSIAAYNSSYFEYVITIFMLLFSVNFNLFYLMVMRDFKNVWRNEELRVFIGIVCVATLLITLNIYRYYPTLETAFRHAVFQVAAIMSTTGFVTVNFDLWPEFSKTILFCLLFLGACGGSTAGGIKISRFIILMKMVLREIKRIIHPRSVNLIKLDGYKIEEDSVRGVAGFIIVYIFILLSSFILISLDNFDFATNMTAITTCLSNVGPGLNMAGPTESLTFFSPFSKLLLCLVMLLGRLEIFPILMLFAPSIWRKSYM
ncbi:MAG: TrkH family potassium uptake protein [Anaerotignum sp.]|nr:TrkH family potassium uptake protein [Anaerotignum sp.]